MSEAQPGLVGSVFIWGKRLTRMILWPFRTLVRLTRGALTALIVLSLCFSLLTASVLAVSATAFALASTMVEAVFGAESLRRRQQSQIDTTQRRHADEVAGLNSEIDTRDRRLTEQADEVDIRGRRLDQQADEIADLRMQIDTGNRRVALLGDELAEMSGEIDARDLRLSQQADEIAGLSRETQVLYRGTNTQLRDAIADTTERVRVRVTRGTKRNIASIFGEGIPLFGIAVAVAATGLEVNDACSTMEDMYLLDISMNPEHVVTDRPEVCGLRIPTVGEVWQKILASPGSVWDSMKVLYVNLPTLGEIWDSVAASPGQIWGVITELYGAVLDIDWPDPIGAVSDWWNGSEGISP